MNTQRNGRVDPVARGLALGAILAVPTNVLSIESFGAVGDGITNDTFAFRLAAAAINAQGGGTIKLAAGKTYIVGLQLFAGVVGKGYAYKSLNPLEFSNCNRPVIIDGSGSKIQYASGLHFGAFDPVTGVAETGISTNPDYAADLGYCISGTNSPGGVAVNDLEIDGNNINVVLGGQYGDTGYQLGHYGVYWESTRAVATRVYSHNMCLDGFAVKYPNLTAGQSGRAATFIDCVADYNSRQGLSWVGGRSLMAIGCKFNNTGKGPFQSLPGAGVDIEPEDSVSCEGTFIGCTFANNAGAAVLSAPTATTPYDIKFVSCSFFGTTGPSMWPNGKRFKFFGCKFSGQALGNFSGAKVDATDFIACEFNTERYNGIAPYGTGLIDVSTFARFTQCSFETTDPNITLGASVAGTEYTDCTFLQNGSTGTANIWGLFKGTTQFDVTTGANNFAATSTVVMGTFTGTGNWQAIDTYSLGNGVISAGVSTPPISRGRRLGYGATGFASLTDYSWNTPLPPVGPRQVGEITWETSPVVGGKVGSVITSAGDPGTAQPFGIVGAVQSASVAFADSSGPTKAQFDALVTALKNAKLMA